MCAIFRQAGPKVSNISKARQGAPHPLAAAVDLLAAPIDNRSQDRCVRLPRALLQSETVALDDGYPIRMRFARQAEFA
jgi:hypothetical protein